MADIEQEQLLGNESDEEVTESIDNSDLYNSTNINATVAVYEQNEYCDTKINRLFTKTDNREPKDKYHAAYIIFYIMGMNILIPWVFFITAEDYWMYKFRNVNNVTTDDLSSQSPLQKNFQSYLSIASSVPSVCIFILCVFVNKWISLNVRIMGSIITMFVLFIVTTVFVKIDTDAWQEMFFIVTMTTVVLLNCAAAVLSSAVFGLVGKFKPRHITAVTGGQAIGGIFAALVEIMSITFSVSATVSAFTYFMIANVTLVISLGGYIVLTKLPVFIYYTLDKQSNENIQSTSVSISLTNTVSYKAIFQKVWVLCLGMWLVFVVTLSVYPTITGIVESTNYGTGSKWTDVYFVSVIAFLWHSSNDYVGRVLSGRLLWPSNGWTIVAINITRLALVPLLMLCNAQPRSHLPVLIDNDYVYILLVATLGFSNGYMTNSIFIAGSKKVEVHEKEAAGIIISAFLGIGLATGSLLSFLTRTFI